MRRLSYSNTLATSLRCDARRSQRLAVGPGVATGTGGAFVLAETQCTMREVGVLSADVSEGLGYGVRCSVVVQPKEASCDGLC